MIGCTRRMAWAVALAAVGVLASGLADAGAAGSAAFQVTAFKVLYGGSEDPEHALHGGHPGLPTLGDVGALPISLGEAADGYVAPGEGAGSVTIRLSEPSTYPKKRFYAGAIRSISRQVLALFQRRGLAGVFVAPHPEDIIEERTRDAEGRVQVSLSDRRPKGRTELRIAIWVGAVTEVRTLASGDRVPKEARVNNPRHAAIRAGSPVGPPSDDAPFRDVLLRRERLQRYVYYLSRHPSRRVDVALSAGEQPGAMVLDYLVTESKPWYAYLQVSDTGTQYTDRWRQRVGFVHNQLTGNDDILSFDYVTTAMDETNMVLLSYEAPFFGMPRLRWRAYGSWSEYEASDVGLAREEFEGETWTAGGEVIGNVFQRGRLFVDAVGGVRWEDHEVDDRSMGVTGRVNLWVPYAGFRFDRLTETASTWGSVILEYARPHDSHEELTELGRIFPDNDWAILKFDLQQSVYLEPLLNPAAWEDPSTPQSSTLAHELFFAVRGQRDLGSRSIPQHQHTLGGLYTVRGYPESILAGDSCTVATFEYRFHVPRLFPPPPARKSPVFGTPFKWAPQQVYGRPDWDLILRCFYDVGRVTSVRAQTFEVEDTLRGAGVGVEVRVKQYITVRCDYAVALEDVATASRRVNSGNNEIHTVVTISF